MGSFGAAHSHLVPISAAGLQHYAVLSLNLGDVVRLE